MWMNSERSAIAGEIVHKSNPKDGSLGEIVPEETVVSEGIIREMEIGVLMDIQTAENLRKWLDDKIKQYKQQFPAKGKS